MKLIFITEEQIQFIREENKDCEQTKSITDNMLAFMIEHQLFKLFVPEALGGKMLDLPSAIRVFQEASYAESNFGWLVTIGSGGGMFTSNMTEKAAKTYYSPKNAVIAGSGFPAGTAQPTKNGYIISGKWFYCSGSQYATLFTVSCNVKSATGEKNQMLAFILEPDQVDVHEDWDAFGLKGTSTHTIEVVDQFVPDDRAFSVFEKQNAFDHPLYTFPFKLFAETSFAAIALGICKHFLEEIGSILEENKQNWQQGSFNHYSYLKQKLDDEKRRWKKTEQAFHEVIQVSWDKHTKGEELTEAFCENVTTISKRSAASAVYCANNLFRYIGMQAVREENVVNQLWRDLYTASQHALLIPSNEQESLPF